MALCPTLVALCLATFTDLRSRRIPNWVVLPFFFAGPLTCLISYGWPGLRQSLLGILLAIGVLGILYWLGGMGMGDVKLCAAIGGWIGPSQLTLALVLTGLAGGLMAFIWAISNGCLKKSLRGTGNLIFGFGKPATLRDPTLHLKHPAARKMPYAPAIAMGTVLSFLARSSA